MNFSDEICAVCGLGLELHNPDLNPEVFELASMFNEMNATVTESVLENKRITDSIKLQANLSGGTGESSSTKQ